MKNCSDDNDFVLGLEENAIDSLIHAVEHFIANKKPTDLKYTILQLFHALELFLKTRLAIAHPILIYQEPEKAGDNAKTVSFESLTGRLCKVGVDLSKQELEDINVLRKVRNSIEHHRINANYEQIEDYVGRTMRFLETFLQKELNIILKEQLVPEIYHPLSEALYSYEERLEKAQQEREKHLPARPKDRLLYQILVCEECGEETVTVPDPTSKDGTVHCTFCAAQFYTEECMRCSSVMLSSTPFNENNHLGICDVCEEQIADYD